MEAHREGARRAANCFGLASVAVAVAVAVVQAPRAAASTAVSMLSTALQLHREFCDKFYYLFHFQCIPL